MQLYQRIINLNRIRLLLTNDKIIDRARRIVNGCQVGRGQRGGVKTLWSNGVLGRRTSRRETSENARLETVVEFVLVEMSKSIVYL